jgi:hypothetical protein
MQGGMWAEIQVHQQPVRGIPGRLAKKSACGAICGWRDWQGGGGGESHIANAPVQLVRAIHA